MNTYLLVPFATALLIPATSGLGIQNDSKIAVSTNQFAQVASELRVANELLLTNTATEGDSDSATSASSVTSVSNSDTDGDSSDSMGLVQVGSSADSVSSESSESSVSSVSSLSSVSSPSSVSSESSASEDSESTVENDFAQIRQEQTCQDKVDMKYDEKMANCDGDQECLDRLEQWKAK